MNTDQDFPSVLSVSSVVECLPPRLSADSARHRLVCLGLVFQSFTLWQALTIKKIRGFGRLFAPVCAYSRLKLTAVRVSRTGRSSLVTEITVNYAYLRQITVNYGSFVAARELRLTEKTGCPGRFK